MPTPTIPAGNLFMNATLYTGNNSTQTIINGPAGASFQPDFAWSKNRSNARSHALVNSIAGATLQLQSNTTVAEFTGGFASLNSNGFSLNNNFNENNINETYVCWQWKAGGTAVSNTSGTITSQVSANTTSGFSVVTYTGNGTGTPTIGHGLGVAPSMVIVKTRSTANGWVVYHQSLGATQSIILNGTNAASTQTDWGNTTPTSTVFYVNGGNNNISAATYVAYCWAPIAGYSAFGSYTGNGSTDGPFVYTNFQPRWVMIKRTDSAGYDWVIYDTSRNTYNAVTLNLDPNSSAAETNTGSSGMDILSNGFKLRDASLFWNASGGTYVYACFASNPFKYSNAR